MKNLDKLIKILMKNDDIETISKILSRYRSSYKCHFCIKCFDNNCFPDSKRPSLRYCRINIAEWLNNKFGGEIKENDEL